MILGTLVAGLIVRHGGSNTPAERPGISLDQPLTVARVRALITRFGVHVKRILRCHPWSHGGWDPA